MDSDDNCLVIDESEADNDINMEVLKHLSKTPNETEIPMNGTETTNDVSHQENEATASSTPLTTTPRAESTQKQKERNGEKTKPKDDKNKTKTPSKDKKNCLSKKTQYVRLTQALFKEKLLNISAQKHHLYNMQFSLRGSMLNADIPVVFPAPSPFPDINLMQLLNYPGIKITVSLDHFSFAHEIRENCDRDIVLGDDALTNVNVEKNSAEIRYLQKVPSSKTYPMVSKNMVETYVTSLIEAAPLYEVGPSKLPEIHQSFRKIIEDIARIPYPSIQTRITHSYFFNEQKYFRVFDNDTANNKNLKVRLRETINPEVNFWVKRCVFTSDQMNDWQNAIDEFFEDVLVKRNHRVKDALRERYKKCLTLKCEQCNEFFEGPLWSVKLKDHIKQKHFVDKPWTCVNCKLSWNQSELLQMGWKHSCDIRQ